MRTRHLLRRLAVVVAFAGCGPAPAPETPPPAAPPPAPPPAPTVVSPARWLVRHPETLEPTASRKLPGGGTLHASEHGERWITPDEPAPAPGADRGAPRLTAASFMLPEKIIAIAPSDGKWAFFGVSGRAFRAASPLGAIEEARPAPAPVRSVGAGSAAIVAVTRGGDLLRSTDGGAHWNRVSVPALGPAVPNAVAMRPDGVGLLQALPERALVTADDGATWTPIALPPGGPRRVEVSEEGGIWLASTDWEAKRTHALEGKPPAFVAHQGAPAPVDRSRKDRDAARYENDSDTQRAVGKKYILSVARPYNNDPWKVQVSEWDREGEWKAIPELVGCLGNRVAAAAWDDELVLACTRADAKSAASAAARGTPLKIDHLAIYRSKDGGASWAEDGVAPLWAPYSWILAGPEGWLLVHRNCPKDAKECTPFLLRPAAGQPFATLSVMPDTNYERWQIDPPRHRIVALSGGGSPKAARVQTWGLDGKDGRTTELFATESNFQGSFTIDEQGAIVVAAEQPDKDATTKPGERAPDVWRIYRSTDEGATFLASQLALPALAGAPATKIRNLRLVGDRGIAVDGANHLWESADGAKTWLPVTGPSWRGNLIDCAREGCALGPELRHGWDLATPTSLAPPAAARVEPSPRVPGGTPLRCSAGEGKEIASALIDDLDDLARAPLAAGNLIVPVAGKGLDLDLIFLTAAEGKVTSKATSVFPAAPNRAAVGSHTDVLLTDAGVLASRSTFPVDSAGADVWISPVTAEIAWWRPKDGKVLHGRVPPLGKGHMRGTFSLGERAGDNSEVFSLTADAAYYRPDVGRAPDLFTFTDKGAPAKAAAHALPDARAALRTPSGLALLAFGTTYGAESGRVSTVQFAFGANKHEDPGTTWAIGPADSPGVIRPLQRGADGAVVTAWSDDDGAPHGFILPLKPGDTPTEITDLGLASLLVEHPRACGEGLDPASLHVLLLLPRAARHAVLVEGGPKPALVRVDSAIVVVPPQGQPCVSEWIAHGEKDKDLAIVPVADPRRAWSVTATPTDWQNGLRARTLDVRALRCEEAPGLAIPASFEWKGF